MNEIAFGTATSNYYVVQYDVDQLAPEPLKTFGNKEFLMNWHFYLLNTTDNTGDATIPVGQLKMNLFQFIDGTYAPVVGITEAMKAECNAALYLNEDRTNQYCEAGQFDPAAFYKEYGTNTKLYTAAGTEVRILRPWETTETKYTIGMGRMDTLYLVDNVIGKSGKVWKGIFTEPIVWDGIDISRFKLPPTALAPCPVCTIDGKARNSFLVYQGENNCRSAKDQEGLCTLFDNDRNYPRINDMTGISNADFARSNNADPNKSYPFAEGSFFALNTYITCMELYYGTKHLHKSDFFTSGISSNDSCINEATYLANGGTRYKVTGTDAWKYLGWSSQPTNLLLKAGGTKTIMSAIFNQEYPKEQCMESQMAASFALETGVAENTPFEFYGATYSYKNVPGTKGLTEDSMQCIVYKQSEVQTINAFSAEGVETQFDLQYNLRMALYNGMNLSGDILAYWAGGYEQVGTTAEGTFQTDNEVRLYLEPDQTKWIKDINITIKDPAKFIFEDKYLLMGVELNTVNSWTLFRNGYTAWKKRNGGSISTGECCYIYSQNNWLTTTGNRIRIGARFRGYTYYDYCSCRFSFLYSVLSRKSCYTAGSIQSRLQEIAS